MSRSRSLDPMDLGLDGKVFIVTGGARGLGRATADLLVAEGARVVLSGRSEASLETAVADLGDAAVGVVADNAIPGSEDLLLSVAHDSFGRIDGALLHGGNGSRAETDANHADRVRINAVFLQNIFQKEIGG